MCTLEKQGIQFKIIVTFLGLLSVLIPVNTIAQSDGKYLEDVIVFKIRNASATGARMSTDNSQKLEEISSLTNTSQITQIFPPEKNTSGRVAHSEINNIYKIRIQNGDDLWNEIYKLRQMDFIEYAEPYFVNEILAIPNDPAANPYSGQQSYLSIIDIYNAWNVSQGDTSMVIGIVDTGVKFDHEDLGNVALNYDDPVNGLDDDGDGFVDNFRGWDIADNDNNPVADGMGHGTFVSGLAAASTNNAIGMAGTGYKSKFLPVKISSTPSNILINEYEGIVYAANHGCKVVNLSWGGAGNFSSFGQSVINYVVEEKDVVVIAAAGNTHAELDFYPASYNNVLSVGASDYSDNLASWATFSKQIDILAPGELVYSTNNNGGYNGVSGTSFASPMVAGVAGLVRTRFPELNARQVIEQIRVTSDDVYSVGSNMSYQGMLGKGRLNAYKAVTDNISPSIRIAEVNYKSRYNDLIFPGDTVTVEVTFINYLRTAKEVSVSLSSDNPGVQILNNSFQIQRLGEYEQITNSEIPFEIVVSEDIKPGATLDLRVDLQGIDYSDFEYFNIRITPEYFDILSGDMSITIASDGDLGYDKDFLSSGSGLAYMGQNISNWMGLMIGTDSMHLMDNLINNYNRGTRDKDFASLEYARLFDNSQADTDARSSFTYDNTKSSALGLKINQKVLGWNGEENKNSLIIEYFVTNITDSTISDLDIGLFADWELGNFYMNKAAWDETHNLGYVFYDNTETLFAGAALLTGQVADGYSVDVGSFNGNTGEIDGEFNDVQKYRMLSGDHVKHAAGVEGAGNNVAQIVSGHQISLLPGQSEKIAFVLTAGNSLESLRNEVQKAKALYTDYVNNPPVLGTFYACTGSSAEIDPVSGNVFEFYQDPQMTLRLDSSTVYTTDPVSGSTNYYIVNTDLGYRSDVGTVIVKPGDPTASFMPSTDTLLIEQGEIGEIKFHNQSVLDGAWKWNFGNGYQSIVENPSTVYTQEGLYDISLIVSNKYECKDTTHMPLVVGVRGERPVVHDQIICEHDQVAIQADNTGKIAVYADQTQKQLLYSGDAFLTDALSSDTVFYITNIASTYESIAMPLSVEVEAIDLGFSYAIDTLESNDNVVVKVVDDVPGSGLQGWMVNEAFFGNEESFLLGVGHENILVKQIKMNDYGCIDSVEYTIEPVTSVTPVVNNMKICEGSDVKISPENGKIFRFYADNDLTDLLHVGSELNVEEITTGTSIFVTGLDGLIESDPAEMVISVSDLQASINTQSDSYTTSDLIELQDNSIGSTTTYWFVDNILTDSVRVFSPDFNQPGQYTVSMIVYDEAGCVDSTSRNLRITMVTGVEENISEAIGIYPNPSVDFIQISLDELSDRDARMVITNVSGNIVSDQSLGLTGQPVRINVSGFNTGMYLVKIFSEDLVYFGKFLKK